MNWDRQIAHVRRELDQVRATDTEAESSDQAEACREDINAFMEWVFTDPRTGNPFRQAAVHREWHSHIDRTARALILAPREHGKSDQIAIGRVLWELGRNPQLRIKLVCEDDSMARKRLKAVKGHIERNVRLHEAFPGLRKHPLLDDWSKHTITVNRDGEDKDPSTESCGVLSSAVGGRADLLIFDDVCDFRNSIGQPALRGLVKETVDNVWINLLADEGRAIYIATPWHEGDLTNALKGNPEWDLLEQPIPEDFTPLWPEMWPESRLRQRAREIGSRAFSRGFRLVALSDEDALFRSITTCLHPELSLLDIYPRWPRFTGVDLGHSKRKGEGTRSRFSRRQRPYTVIFTIAVDPQQRRWPVEIRRGHWSGPETARQILDVHETHQPTLVMVESNAYQGTLLDWIRLVSQDRSIPLKAFTTGTNKADEQIGLPGLAAEFDNGAWVIPTDGLDLEELESSWKAWILEMRTYPVAPLSDTVMACWFAREASRGRVRDPELYREIHKFNMEATDTIAGGIRTMLF